VSGTLPDDDDGFARLPGGGVIAYQVRGRRRANTPVLLIRPLGGSMALWGSFRTALAEQHRVVSFDHPGCGRSSLVWTSVTTRGLAACAARVLDHLAIPRAHVFGISLGGMAATWLGVDRARVVSLCLASTPARGIEFNRAGLRRELGLAACLARPEEEVEAALVHRVLSRRFREVEPEAVRNIERQLRATAPTSRRALVMHAVAGLLHDARGKLQLIEAPTLVLAAQNDTLLGVTAPRELADDIPGSVFEVVPCSGHDLTLERPHVTAARVADFFHSVA
jgi:pimeloyl-ACP methyl ester carboxylesterase